MKLRVALASLLLIGSSSVAAAPQAQASADLGGDLVLHTGRRVHVQCANFTWKWTYQNNFSPCKHTRAWVAPRDRRFVRDFTSSGQRYGWIAPGVTLPDFKYHIVNVYACSDGRCKDSSRKYKPAP